MYSSSCSSNDTFLLILPGVFLYFAKASDIYMPFARVASSIFIYQSAQFDRFSSNSSPNDLIELARNIRLEDKPGMVRVLRSITSKKRLLKSTHFSIYKLLSFSSHLQTSLYAKSIAGFLSRASHLS